MYELSFQDPFDSPRNSSENISSSRSRRSDSEVQISLSCRLKLQKSLTQTINYSPLNDVNEAGTQENNVYSSPNEKLKDFQPTTLHKLSYLDFDQECDEYLHVSHLNLSPEGPKVTSLETKENNSPNKSMNQSINGEIFLNTVINSVPNIKKRNINIDTFIDQIIRNSEFLRKGLEVEEFNYNLIKFINLLADDLNSLEYHQEGVWTLCCFKLNQFEKILKLKTENLNHARKIQIFKQIAEIKKCESWTFNEKMTLVDLCLMGDILHDGYFLVKEIRLIDIYEVVEQFTTYFFNRMKRRYSKVKTRHIDLRYFFYNIKMFLIQEL